MTKSSTPKAAAKKGRGTHRNPTPRCRQRARDTHQQIPLKVVAEKAQLQRKRAPKVIAGEVGDTGRRIAAQFEEFRVSSARYNARRC